MCLIVWVCVTVSGSRRGGGGTLLAPVRIIMVLVCVYVCECAGPIFRMLGSQGCVVQGCC